MAETYSETNPEQPQSVTSTTVVANPRDLLSAFIVGALVGLAISGLYYLLNEYVFSAVMCRGDGGDCQQAPTYSMVIATLFGSLGGLVALVQARIYRPLLVVIAATLSLWSLQSMIGSFAWYWGIVIAMLLFGLMYALYAWLVRIRSFLLAVVLVVVMVVVIRLVAIS